MDRYRIAIVGLGRVGGFFLNEMLKLHDRGLDIVACVEIKDTPGKIIAEDAGVPVVTMDELVAMGREVDVIFELTGSPAVRADLRQDLDLGGNRHTVVVSTLLARLISRIISEDPIPDLHADSRGY